MKKLSVLGMLILVAMFSFTAKADVITLDGANEIANAFFANSASSQKRALKSAAQLEYAWDSNSLTQTGSSMMKSADEDPTFYVFNNPNGEGFVIVSGDSNARSVIGYSYEGSVPMADEIPDAMKDYLLGIDEEIKWARTNLTSGNSNLKSAEVPDGGNIVKYLETPSWGQGSPYNSLCPTINGSSTKTGCVPTAFASVLRYHKWPAQATGTFQNSGNEIVLGHTYDWDSMPLTAYSTSWTDAQKTQVATIMRDLGYALSASYGTGSTDVTISTSTADAIKNYFNYKSYEGVIGDYAIPSAINDINTWKEKINNSLNNGCPIPYASNNTGTGDTRHMFVLDGYTDNDYYHFNFGWQGGGNGWFQLSAITPAQGDNYSWGSSTGSKHLAYFNLMPDKTTYSVTATATPSNMGTVSVNMGTAGTTATAEMYNGATATLTAYPADGYALASWTKNGVVVGSKNTIEVQVGTSDNDYVANFDLASNVLVTKDYIIQPSTVGLTGSSKVGVVTYQTSEEYPAALSLASTNTNGVSVSGMSRIEDDQIKLYGYAFDNSDKGYTSIKYTLSVPDGYIITEYSFDYSINLTSYPCSITYSGGTISSPSNTQWYSLPTVSVNAQTAEFTITAEKTNTGSNFYIKNFNVTVAKEGGVTPPAGESVSVELFVNSFDDSITDDELNNNCSVSSNVQTAVVGGQITLTATAKSGYKFDAWYSFDGTKQISTANPATITITEDIVYDDNLTVYAAFSKDDTPVTPTQYTASVSAGTGGTATVAVVGTGTGSSSVKADKGTNVEFTATPATGYEFVNWTGTTISGENPLTLPLNADINLTANFRQTEQGGGEVEAPEYCIPSGTKGNDNYLTTVTTSGAKENISYSASSHPGSTYKLVDGVIKVNPGTSFTLNLEANSLGAGSNYTVREDIRYCHASLFTDFDINGDFGNAVQTWGNKPPTHNVYGNYDQCMNIAATINVPSNAAIGKSHIRVIYTNAWTDYPTACTKALDKGIAYDFVIEVIKTYTVTVSTNGTGGTATVNGGQTATVASGTEVTFTATTNTGYNFLGWFNGETKVNENLEFTQSVTSNLSLTAKFAKQTFTVSATPNGTNGTVTVSPNTSPVEYGIEVTFTATANPGHRFVSWSNGETANPYTVTVTENISLTANFEEIPTHSVNVSVNGNGSVEKSATSVLEGSTVTLTATPEEGYRFTGWYKDEELISESNPYTVTVTENIELIANFVEIPTYTINVSTNDVNGGTATTSAESVQQGSTVTLTAIPEEGYRFTGWYKDEELISKSNPYTVTVTEAIEYVANFVESSDELLLTFACLSDLHAQESLISGDVNSVKLRESVTKTLTQIKDENVDLIVLGGDYTSNNTISKESWEKTRELLVNATRGAFNGTKKPVIYVNGNHEYEVANCDNLPKNYNAGEYYGTPMKTDIGALAAEDCFYETATNTNGTPGTVDLLAAYHYVVNGFDFVVLNTGKNFFASASNYSYSLESVNWCATKLAEIYKKDKDKTVFFLVHIPFSDSKGISNLNKGMASGDAATLLKSTLAQYPNLIMLYGHDHGGDKAYIREETEERVTEYATDGSVYTGEGASQENLTYYIENFNTGKYLGFNSYNLATTAAQSSDVTFTASTSVNNAFVFSFTGYVDDKQYLHCGSSDHNYSGNGSNSAVNQQIYLYKVADPTAETITATLSTTIEAGKTYMFVARNSATGTAYYALSNVMSQEGTDSQRMLGVEVTITDGTITYTPGTASVLWTINSKSSSEKSFFSSFMGSMRYYENSFEEGQLADRRIIQALMVYVYSDRVELKMKNYGEGDVTANGITVNQDLDSYVSYRTVTHSAEAVTATPTITSQGGVVNPGSITVTVDAPEWYNLYYTLDGTEPTESSDKVEKGQITFTAVEGEYVIKVAAQEGIRLMSEVASVTYTVVDTHGITVSTTVEGVDAQFTINETDKTVTLTVAEIEGYEFVNWTMNGTEVATTREATILYTQGAQYIANFAKQTFTVTVVANPTEGGTVTEVANPVEYGTTLELTATPNSGYQFVNWTLGETVVSNSATFTTEAITADAQYVANFDEVTLEEIYAEMCKPGFTHGGNNNNTYISAATINEESITVPAKVTLAAGHKQEGATAQIPVYKGIDYVLDLTFVANWGDIILYQIVNGKTDDITPIYGPYEGSWANGRQTTEVLNEMDKAGITVNGSTASFPLTFSNDLNIGDLVVVRVVVGNEVNTPCPTGINEGGYVDFLFVVAEPPVRTVKIATNDKNLGYAGYVSPQPEGTATDVTTSEPVTVMAYLQPDANSRFVNWTINDDVVGTDPTYTYYGTESVTIQANFAELAEVYSVNVSSNNRTWGSAKKSISGSVAEDGSRVTFTATAYDGYEFVEWQNAQGAQVSTSASYTMVISSNTALTAIFQETNGLTGKWYRIKEVNSGNYLNAANYQPHTSGSTGGVNAVAKNNSNDQIFKFVASGTNYTLKTRSEYNIVCQQWNVDALTSAGTVLRITETTYDSQKAIKINIASPGSNQRNGAFKIQNVEGTYYPFCDANNTDIATWVLEPVKISEVSVEKTSDNATIKVTTDQAATIKVGGNGFGSTTADNLTATLTLGATAGNVGDDIKIESINGYITSIECVENIELTDVPVTVTEIALRNTKEEEVVVDAPALSKITVVSDAENNVAKVSTTSDLSQGVQVVVEKEIYVPYEINGKTPTYFNFLSMPFAFNTANIEYLNGGSWTKAVLEQDIRILKYDSEKRAENDYENTWETLKADEDIVANQGFVIVGNSDLGDTDHKMKLRFTSAPEAYDGKTTTVTANAYRKDVGETSSYDTDWNFNGVPFLTNGLMDGYTLYFHNGYRYVSFVSAEKQEISAYQGVMYQANLGEDLYRDIEISASVANATNDADDVFARAYISVDDAAPAKIILSDESSENFVVNEDAWYLAPTADAEAAAYFNIGGANASVTVQPAASELPMTVYTGAGTQHRITLSATDGNYDVYLKDAATDEVVCLNNEDYTFTATANKTIANRFTVSMVEFTGIIDAARAEGTIKVVVAGDLIKLFGTEEGDQVALYTANGMLITNAIAEDGVTNIETSANGVIIIKVADQTVKVVK